MRKMRVIYLTDGRVMVVKSAIVRQADSGRLSAQKSVRGTVPENRLTLTWTNATSCVEPVTFLGSTTSSVTGVTIAIFSTEKGQLYYYAANKVAYFDRIVRPDNYSINVTSGRGELVAQKLGKPAFVVMPIANPSIEIDVSTAVTLGCKILRKTK